jgi:hypothetical protein
MAYFGNGRTANMTYPGINTNGINYLDELKMQVKI